MTLPARIFLLFLLISPVSSRAQTNPPIQVDEPPSASPSPNAKEEKKKNYVRLWNYSFSAGAPSVAVFLGPPGDKVPPFEKRLFIARGSKCPEQRNWFEVPKGDYEIYVVADDAVPGDMGVKIGPDAPPQPSLLGKRQGLRVDGGSYQTVFLQPLEGQIVAKVLDDSAASSGATRLRVFTCNTPVRPTVSILANNGSQKPLLEKVGPEGADVLLTNQPNPLTLEISYPLRPDFISRQNLEIDYDRFKSSTIIFAPDRYGELSALSTNDAPKVAPLSNPAP